MSTHVLVLLREAIWRSYNGHEAKAVPGIRTPVPKLPKEAIWRCYNGREAKAVPGTISRYAMLLLIGAI